MPVIFYDGLDLVVEHIPDRQLAKINRSSQRLMDRTEDTTEYQAAEVIVEHTEAEMIRRQAEGITVDEVVPATREQLYELAQLAEIGETVACPVCRTEFVKAQATHSFCSNNKTRTGGNCKDRYWNQAGSKRRTRR